MGRIVNPFAPRGYLESYNSLNRLIIGSGSNEGRQGVDLLSSDSVILQIKESRLSSLLEDSYPEREWPRGMSDLALGSFCPSGCSSSQLKGFQKEAWNITETFARGAACFFETLLTGPEDARKVRSDWKAEHWEWWAGTKRIILGGGLCRGAYRKALEEFLSPLFHKIGSSLVFSSRDDLTMVGASILVSRDVFEKNEKKVSHLAAFDFGHSSVKRGIYPVVDGFLGELIPLVSVGTPRDFSMLEGTWHADRDALREFFFGLLEKTVKEGARMGYPPSAMGISLANYVQDGRVVPRGLFGFLAGKGVPGGDNIGIELTEFCRRRGWHEKAWSLVHDGTAAAAPYWASQERTAVILLGSAIGGGFPLMKPSLKIRAL